VAGSLVSSQVNGDWIESFVLGIGLNLAVTPTLGAAGWFVRATALSASGIELALAAAFPALRDQLARRIVQLQQLDGPEQFFRAYQKRSGIIGKLVAIHPEEATSPGDEPLAAGRLLAIHPDLSLEIEGCGERIRRGRLMLAPAYPTAN
jgi:biotin-(acetyl-CoA carboxylase) ligase